IGERWLEGDIHLRYKRRGTEPDGGGTDGRGRAVCGCGERETSCFCTCRAYLHSGIPEVGASCRRDRCRCDIGGGSILFQTRERRKSNGQHGADRGSGSEYSVLLLSHSGINWGGDVYGSVAPAR